MTITASSSALSRSVHDEALAADVLFNIRGWVAIVTGGGTGLGLVTANALAANGARVYITGRREGPLREAERKSENGKGGEIIAVVADLSNKEGILALLQQISSKEQYINVLINNHGVSMGATDINDCEQTPQGLSDQMFNGESFETWGQTYQINTASYHFTTFAFLPLLAAATDIGGFSEPGNVINLSSISGMTVTSQRGQFNYNASKAATIALSKMQATEFARRNLKIRVNCICPGYFPSGMTVIDPQDNQGSSEHNDTFRKGWGIPFARPGRAVDYAQCIFGLITNQYVTGTDLIIDGGWLLESAF